MPLRCANIISGFFKLLHYIINMETSSTYKVNQEKNKKNKEIYMFAIDRVVFYKWTPQDGKLLKALRGKVTREQLAEKISQLGGECSAGYIKKLELGKSQSISPDIAIVICQALGINPQNLLEMHVLTN